MRFQSKWSGAAIAAAGGAVLFSLGAASTATAGPVPVEKFLTIVTLAGRGGGADVVEEPVSRTLGDFNQVVSVVNTWNGVDVSGSRGTIKSNLSAGGLSASGELDAWASVGTPLYDQDKAGSSRAYVRALDYFEVTQPTDYTFTFAVGHDQLPSFFNGRELANFRLFATLPGGYGADHNVFGDSMLGDEVFTAGGTKPNYTFTTSGRLDPGHYGFEVNLSAYSFGIGEDHAEYDFNFTIGNNAFAIPETPQAIPLPAAGWAGLITLGGLGGGQLLRRRRGTGQ